MGIAGSKEIRHLGWLAGKVGMRGVFCGTLGVSDDLRHPPVQGVCVLPWIPVYTNEAAFFRKNIFLGFFAIAIRRMVG